ncbi:hypothetical protein M9H77_31126 [Catharanthus roseus]|uniref:Uncharacterized protein n=1 Tax=Catharanthus roseus TaxID=4058 RepID=A0ACC0A189_CATRO|nr:hypothetical protein M9H77_31126 [Catharanthus roseus]
MSTQAHAPTPFGEESSNSRQDDPLRLIMQELQSLRDEMRDIRRDVTNFSNQQREVSPHGSVNVTTPRTNGPFNFSRTIEFHQPLHFDEELHPPLYGGRRGAFGGRGMPRHFEEVPRPQARHGELLYDDHEHDTSMVSDSDNYSDSYIYRSISSESLTNVEESLTNGEKEGSDIQTHAEGTGDLTIESSYGIDVCK